METNHTYSEENNQKDDTIDIDKVLEFIKNADYNEEKKILQVLDAEGYLEDSYNEGYENAQNEYDKEPSLYDVYDFLDFADVNEINDIKDRLNIWKIETLDDQFKSQLLEKAFKKYTVQELEERLQLDFVDYGTNRPI